MNGTTEHQADRDRSHGRICLTLCNQVSHLSLSSHPSTPPGKDDRDTGDTWDTIKCVSVALGNETLRGLTSLASRDAVAEAYSPVTVAVGGLRPYATTDTSHWGTLRRPPYFCSGLAAHAWSGPPMQIRPKTFFGGYDPLGFGGQFLRS